MFYTKGLKCILVATISNFGGLVNFWARRCGRNFCRFGASRKSRFFGFRQRLEFFSQNLWPNCSKRIWGWSWTATTPIYSFVWHILSENWPQLRGLTTKLGHLASIHRFFGEIHEILSLARAYACITTFEWLESPCWLWMTPKAPF